VLTLAGAVAVAQGGQGGQRRVNAGQVVGQEGGGLHRLAVGAPVEREEAAHGLGQRVVAHPLAQRAELPVAAD
jgi:hypothetical protein